MDKTQPEEIKLTHIVGAAISVIKEIHDVEESWFLFRYGVSREEDNNLVEPTPNDRLLYLYETLSSATARLANISADIRSRT